jgi:hypothetical protein
MEPMKPSMPGISLCAYLDIGCVADNGYNECSARMFCRETDAAAQPGGVLNGMPQIPAHGRCHLTPRMGIRCTCLALPLFECFEVLVRARKNIPPELR